MARFATGHGRKADMAQREPIFQQFQSELKAKAWGI
jgi:hypothetical protein